MICNSLIRNDVLSKIFRKIIDFHKNSFIIVILYRSYMIYNFFAQICNKGWLEIKLSKTLKTIFCPHFRTFPIIKKTQKIRGCPILEVSYSFEIFFNPFLNWVMYELVNFSYQERGFNLTSRFSCWYCCCPGRTLVFRTQTFKLTGQTGHNNI